MGALGVLGFGESIQELAAGDHLRPFIGLREVSGVASYEVVRLGGFGAFEESIVGFVGRDGKGLGRRYAVRNLADGGQRRINVPGLELQTRAAQHLFILGQQRSGNIKREFAHEERATR